MITIFAFVCLFISGLANSLMDVIETNHWKISPMYLWKDNWFKKWLHKDISKWKDEDSSKEIKWYFLIPQFRDGWHFAKGIMLLTITIGFVNIGMNGTWVWILGCLGILCWWAGFAFGWEFLFVRSEYRRTLLEMFGGKQHTR